MRTVMILACLAVLLAQASPSFSQQAKPSFSAHITAVTPSTALPKTDAEWRKSAIYSELQKRGSSTPDADLKTFSLGATYPKGEKFSSEKFPKSVGNPFAADMDPGKDPTCKRRTCEQTCTTNKDGTERCTTRCTYSCS